MTCLPARYAPGCSLAGPCTPQTHYRWPTEELEREAGIVSAGSGSSVDFNEMIACHFLLMSDCLIHYTSEGRATPDGEEGHGDAQPPRKG